MDGIQATKFTEVLKLVNDIAFFCIDSYSIICMNVLNREKQRKTKEHIFCQENFFRSQEILQLSGHAGIFAVAAQFQNQAQFWISHRQNQGSFFFIFSKSRKTRSYGKKRCFW